MDAAQAVRTEPRGIVRQPWPDAPDARVSRPLKPSAVAGAKPTLKPRGVKFVHDRWTFWSRIVFTLFFDPSLGARSRGAVLAQLDPRVRRHEADALQAVRAD